MDELDHKIIQLLAENARMPVKDIAQRVSLTSPAVSSRIHRLETAGLVRLTRWAMSLTGIRAFSANSCMILWSSSSMK